MNAVVVKARFNSQTFDGWKIKKGDLGVLQWTPHKRHPRFAEPRVIWDQDPNRKARRTIVSSIEVAGIQSLRVRILIVSNFQ